MLLRATCVVLLTSVFLSTVLTDENLFECDFEHDFCGLYQDQNDDFDWTRQTGLTAIGSTAPHLDHTLMSQEGHYALTETKSTQVHSYIARLVMPQVSPGDETICLEFYHSMYDSGVGELDVYVKPGDGITMHSVWTKEIDQGNSWLSAEIQIQLQSRFQIILEGHVGDGVTGTIAIDDISLRCGSCNNPEIVVTGDTIATGGTDLPQDISEWSSGDDLVCPSYDIQWTSYYTTDETSTASVYLCGSIENISSGGNLLITSPEYPDFYPNNARCEWIVYAPYSWRHIYVEWKSFRTQSCCDFISAGNGEIPGKNVVIDMHSGSPMPPNFFSTGNSVWIRFVSDESVQDYGFRVALHDTYLQEESTVEPTSWPYWWTPTPEPYICGQTFYLSYFWDYAVIESPNYPSNYPNNARCVWFVHASYSWRYLDVWWDDFCTESCCDFVSAGNGNVPGQNVVINQHSGCSTPSSFYSSGDTIWITFTSDSSVINRGFRVYVNDEGPTVWPGTEGITSEDYRTTAEETTEEATTSMEVTTRDWWWQTTDDRWRTTPYWWDTTPGTYECGETYYLSYWSHARIESPNYPSNYPNNARCKWFVHAAASWRYLSIWWNDFCTESCCDFVSAGNGGTPGQNVVINQHSGCSTPSSFYSSGDTIWITFTSDGSVTNRGFRVDVYDEEYWYSSEMPWTTDEITTEDFRTTPDVTTEEATTSPETTTRDWWWQTTDDRWRTTPDWWDTTPGTYECGETYYLSYWSTVWIESPNYPSNYPNNARCTWFVHAAASWRYLFIWWDDFCTESCCDFVSAGNGGIPGQNVVINQHSGCSTPPYFYSSGDTIWITFTSDGSVTNRGFRVLVYDEEYRYSSEMPWTTDDYHTIPAETTDEPITLPEETTRDWWWQTTPDWWRTTQDWWDTSPGIYTCGDTYQLSYYGSINIDSPNYPSNYPNNARCVWIVQAAYSWRNIYVDWSDFCTESCCDHVSAGNGNTPGNNVIIDQHAGCGVYPQSFMSSWDTVWLTFYSDSSVTNRGFRVYMYDTDYYSTEMPWTTNEETTSAPEETTPDWWWHTTPNWWDTTPGIYDCGETYYLSPWSSARIDTPYYPGNYPNNARCVWFVHAAYSWGYMYVSWNDFCTEECCDFVSAGNGDVPGQNAVINQHSGCSRPSNFYSSGDTIWLTFASDGSITNKGFRVYVYDQGSTVWPTTEETTVETTEETTRDWWWQTTPYWWDTTPGIYHCGGTIYVPYWGYADIETPNYPSNYPNNADCVWTVHTSYSWMRIYVNWLDFCTETNYDYVSAGDGNTPGNNVRINRYSGCSGYPPNFYSYDNTLWLTFNSDSSVTSRGFRVRMYDTDYYSTESPWTTEGGRTVSDVIETTPEAVSHWWPSTPDWYGTPEPCGGYLDLPSWGYVTIDSPNYPSNYPNNARCEWIIKAAYSWRNLYVSWEDFCTESCCDFVSAGDGNTPGNNVVITRHAGCSLPPNFYSNGDTVWLIFYSDYSVTNRGFRVYMYGTDYYFSTDAPWITSTEATGSCVGYCGGYNPVHGCYCDSVCESAGDCCPDFAEACPNVTTITPSPAYPGYPSTTGETDKDVTVTCAKTSMKIDINRSILGGMDEDDVQLIDPICSGSSNVTHVTFETTHAACGTTFSETSHHIIYQNTVSNRFADEDVIRRLREVEIPFECVYSRKGRADASFVVDSEKLYLTETGHGNFSFNLDFYHDVSYGTPYYDYEYPIQVNLGERIYVGAAVETNTTDLELFLEKCKGTPTENPNHSTQYAFIENGCIKDATVQLHSVDNPAEKHFSIEAFDFVESTSNVVYIHCDMLVCNATDPFSRCQQGCVLRHRRDVGEDSSLGSRTVTQGPINLYRGDVGIVHGLSQGKTETVVESSGQSIMIYAAMAVFVMGSAMAVAAVLYAHHFKRKMKAQIQHA
ncbi:scavenger receptor cysteine-rich domain-containing protein DMBT1-like [Ptychodera flava]|uniref:scavenger receptor cysteine-rich domain-containing protein DMBT1-like n=1 Tax=Ptychodera flava TaxID=63121 RepID=UPI003969FC56